MSMTLKVECYSGYKADERPLRFSFGEMRRKTYEVKEVIDQWYGVGYRCFLVRADDSNYYVLRHGEKEDTWTLVSFRRGEGN